MPKLSKETSPSGKNENGAPAPQGKVAVFRARTLSTVLLWGLVATGLWVGNPTVIGLLLVLFGATACWEYNAMLRADRLLSRSLSIGTLVMGAGHLATVTAVCLRSQGPSCFWVDALTICGAIILSLSVIVLAFPLEERTLRELAATMLGILYIPVLFAYAIRIFFLEGSPGVEGSGVFLLLFLIAVTKSTDMGAYLVGTAIGKNKMIPRVSPGKTWEGFFGALAITVLVAFTMLYFAGDKLHPLTLWDALPLGIVLGLLSVMGDLAASVVKRCLGAKDSGRTLPGIGGILDLIDSLLFTAPVLFLYLLFAAGR